MPYSSRPTRFAPEGKFRVHVSNDEVLDRYLIRDFDTLEQAQAFVEKEVKGIKHVRANVFDDKGNCVHSLPPD